MKKDYIQCGDCMELMKQIPDKGIDLILCDLPYGVTQKNKWDNVIPYEPLWREYKRIIKDNGAILLFGQDKFTAHTMLSNEKMHRYNLIWKKVLTTGFLNANKMPLREHEDIMVFYKRLPTYNPQKRKGNACHPKGKVSGSMNDETLKNHNYGNYRCMDTKGNLKYPTSVLEFPKIHPSISVHPTQKPIELLEYLIKTYSNEWDTVLDNCMGSGSTCVAAVNTKRHYIGFELERNYFDIAEKRIEAAKKGAA